MKAITVESILKKEISEYKANGKKVGFIPTMGALHEGHLSLIRESKKKTDITVCSIFVNPTQFNDPLDFEKYPRTIEEDIVMLQKAGCDLVFLPSVEEVYPEQDTTVYDFGLLDKVMEGAHRPGHFAGVASVVKRLFEMVCPDMAFFGEKDFQQLAIIRALVEKFEMPVEICGCPIVREADGLAMSSRNVRLSQADRQAAGNINKILYQAVAKREELSVSHVKLMVEKEIAAFPQFKMDYFEIVNRDSLQTVEQWGDADHLIACIAVFVGEVRLIDNMFIN